jgi:hypothetical protein
LGESEKKAISEPEAIADKKSSRQASIIETTAPKVGTIGCTSLNNCDR